MQLLWMCYSPVLAAPPPLPQALVVIENCLTWLDVGRGAILQRMGEPLHGIFFICSGTVGLYKEPSRTSTQATLDTYSAAAARLAEEEEEAGGWVVYMTPTMVWATVTWPSRCTCALSLNTVDQLYYSITVVDKGWEVPLALHSFLYHAYSMLISAFLANTGGAAANQHPGPPSSAPELHRMASTATSRGFPAGSGSLIDERSLTRMKSTRSVASESVYGGGGGLTAFGRAGSLSQARRPPVASFSLTSMGTDQGEGAWAES
jgi:hypothetical protein